MEFGEIRNILQPLSQVMVEKSESNKEDRDRWNAEVRGHLDERNEVNRQVKELINEVHVVQSSLAILVLDKVDMWNKVVRIEASSHQCICQ